MHICRSPGIPGRPRSISESTGSVSQMLRVSCTIRMPLPEKTRAQTERRYVSAGRDHLGRVLVVGLGREPKVTYGLARHFKAECPLWLASSPGNVRIQRQDRLDVVFDTNGRRHELSIRNELQGSGRITENEKL